MATVANLKFITSAGFREWKSVFFGRFSSIEMKRPRNWGNCEASKAAIEVWVFGGEQPPKRINCFGGESVSRTA